MLFSRRFVQSESKRLFELEALPWKVKKEEKDESGELLELTSINLSSRRCRNMHERKEGKQNEEEREINSKAVDRKRWTNNRILRRAEY